MKKYIDPLIQKTMKVVKVFHLTTLFVQLLVILLKVFSIVSWSWIMVFCPVYLVILFWACCAIVDV